MSNTVAGRRQFDNSQECIAKKRQWRRHANENTPEQNTSIAKRYINQLDPDTETVIMVWACPACDVKGRDPRFESCITCVTYIYIYTSWIPGFARDPLSRSLSPSLSRPSLPSLLFVPAFYPPSLGLPGFAQDNCIPEILFKP